ncbi:MAG: glycosyltransferase involved in cell wall biosynthesis [Psychroserpens sp.]|jgi:glycosyltransferase involved in cell wall biosynthesis
MDLSVVIPVYNAQRSLEELSQRLLVSLSDITSEFEIIFVNDKSSDSSWGLLQKIGASTHKVKVINLSKNRGQQVAVICGLQHASGSIVVTMDDDLQHSPEDIVLLYNGLIDDPEVDAVVGCFEKKNHAPLRNLATKIVKNYISRSIGVPNELDLTSFRAIREHAVEAMCQMKNQSPVVGFLLFEVTSRVKNITVKHNQRKHDQSSYTTIKLVKYFLTMLNEHMYLPLNMLYWSGLLITLTSIVASGYYFVKYFFGSPTPGFTAVILLLFFTVGSLSLALGVVGKYMIKLMRSIDNIPLYVVKEKNF